MLLNLSVGGQLLATVPVDPEKCKDQHYLDTLTNLLAAKNHTAISVLQKEPLYYIQVGSKINQKVH